MALLSMESTTATQPPGVACAEKLALLGQIKRVSTEMVILQREELDAVLAGQSVDISLRMENAKEMRKLLMERLRNHVALHGC